jgi:hypothetical protein
LKQIRIDNGEKSFRSFLLIEYSFRECGFIKNLSIACERCATGTFCACCCFFRIGRSPTVAVAAVTNNHCEAFKVATGVYPEVTLFLIDAGGSWSNSSKVWRQMMILPRAGFGAARPRKRPPPLATGSWRLRGPSGAPDHGDRAKSLPEGATAAPKTTAMLVGRFDL